MQEGVSIVHSRLSNKGEQRYLFPNTTVSLFSAYFQVKKKIKKNPLEHVKIAQSSIKEEAKTAPTFLFVIYFSALTETMALSLGLLGRQAHPGNASGQRQRVGQPRQSNS